MYVHCDLSSVFQRCAGHGICSFTGKPHVQLVGQQDGIFMTLIAQPYPSLLCAKLSGCLSSAVSYHKAKKVVNNGWLGSQL